MKIITLINGDQALVDDCDFEVLSNYNWFCNCNHGHKYARRSVKNNNKKILMHRDILGITNPKIFVDHIDSNGLNNQRSNLRICTHSQNMANRRKNLKGSSAYKGITKRGNSWRVQLSGKPVGTYDSEIEAALAYNVAASFAFREFAKLNEVNL